MPSVASPTPSCLLKIEPGAAKAATNRRQPPGWSLAACSGLIWKSRVRTAAGRA